MENLFEKISAKLVSTVCKKIGLIDIRTHDVMLFSIKNGKVLPPIQSSYEQIVATMIDCVPKSQKEQLQQDMRLLRILTELNRLQNAVSVDFNPSYSTGEEYRIRISFTYYDDSKSTIIVTFIDETARNREQVELIKKLRRTEERFDFLRTHICEDFIEVNIQTGECLTIHSNSNMVSKNIYKEQIDWFAKNIVAEEERAAYMIDFDLDNLVTSLRQNNNFYTTSYTLIYKDGRHDVLILNALIQDSIANGNEYIVSFAQDITVIKQQEVQNKKLLELSQQDTLTKLYNRSTAERIINKHLADDISATPGTMAIIDIDYFKQVNDNYGHAVGDVVLLQLAKALKNVFRSEDVLCRWGGDEFLVFLKNISEQTIIEGRLERLRIRMLACTTQNHALPVTLSIGVAIASPKSTINSLFKLADTTLYKVKNTGKNGFLIANDE